MRLKYRFLTNFHSFTATDSLTVNSDVPRVSKFIKFRALDFRIKLVPLSFLAQDISLKQKLLEHGKHQRLSWRDDKARVSRSGRNIGTREGQKVDQSLRYFRFSSLWRRPNGFSGNEFPRMADRSPRSLTSVNTVRFNSARRVLSFKEKQTTESRSGENAGFMNLSSGNFRNLRFYYRTKWLSKRMVSSGNDT